MRPLSPFCALDLRGSNNVAIRVGGAQRVVVHADTNLLSSVTTRVSGSTLELALAGSGNLFLGDLTTRDAHAMLSGSGTIHVTAANSLNATITGSGVVFYGRKPTHLVTSVPGNGTILPG
jgi:Putative auto-transporter adhesin, head GIN domain